MNNQQIIDRIGEILSGILSDRTGDVVTVVFVKKEGSDNEKRV